MKHLQPLILGAVVCTAAFLIFPSHVFAQSALPQQAPLNPEFLDYQSNARLGRVQTVTEGEGWPLGFMPTTVDLSILNRSPYSLRDVLGASAPPASYDLRTLGRLTPIENQSSCGSCWTFATMASIESALMPGESRKFSENNLKNTNGFDGTPCGGGTALKSAAYLARWGGPVNDSDDPYSPADSNNSPVRTTPAKHFQEMLIISPRNSATDNDNVKQAVMAYGAVFVAIYIDTANYNATYKSFNYMPASGETAKKQNHGVAIVGWDDHFDRNHFTNPPPGDGAFIIRNSWGTSWGENGYFYLSYYDAVAGIQSPMYAFYGIEPTANWSRLYQYDELGMVVQYGYGTDTAWFANVFTAQDTESIGAVGFYTWVPAAPYSISVYTGVKDVPTSGSLVGTTTGTAATPGYHTIKLARPVGISSGDKFAVVVRLQQPGATHPIAIENAVSGYSSGATARPGESYTSSNGTGWSDLTKFDATANVCLKAYANKTGSGNVQVSVASNPPGQAVIVDGTTYTSGKTFNWAIGSSHTLDTNAVQGSGQTRYVFANWSDGAAQSHTINITQSGAFTANFTTQYQVSVSASPAAGGSVTVGPAAADAYYNSGSILTFTAKAATGYAFDSWSAGLSGNTSPANVTIGQPLTVTAVFRSASASIVTTSPAGLNIVVDGTTYASPHSFDWAANTSHTINAASQGTGTRYVFSKWSDNLAQSHTITAAAGGATYTATFTTQYLLTAQMIPAGSGTISTAPTSTDGYFAAGTSVSLKATAGSGFAFSQWSGALSGTTNPQAVTMSAPRSVTAAFGGASGGLSNDEMSGAAVVGSMPYNVTQNTVGATLNKTDPIHSCTNDKDSRTVWFRFVPAFTGVANISTMGSDYDTVMSAYSTTDGSEIACNDDENELTNTSALVLGVTKGQTIIIEVSAYGSGGTGGRMKLSVNGQALAVASNDEIATSIRLGGLPSSTLEITSTATTNSTDPVHSCTDAKDGKSVWFRFVATYSGYLRVNTIGSDYDTVLSGYSGSSGRELDCSDDTDDSTVTSEIYIPVDAGQTYYLEVSAYGDTPGGLLVLNAMSEGVPPSNDSIDNAFVIPSLPYTLVEDTVDATEADDDPLHSCTDDWDFRTLWFWYDAKFTGTLRINTFGTDYDTVLTVYDGDSGDELVCNDDASADTLQSAVDLNVKSGKGYWIEVSEYDDEYASGGTLYLNVVGAPGVTTAQRLRPIVKRPASPPRIEGLAKRLASKAGNCCVSGNAGTGLDLTRIRR